MPAKMPGPPPGMDHPEEIEIKQSLVDDEALGLWSRKVIRQGTKFGPFMGDKVQEATDDMDPSYVWEIVDLETKEFLFYIDATDPDQGNWMRYINCARYYEEQNIVSEQEGIDIVYRAIKDINPGEELLTWYERAPLRKRRGGKSKAPRKTSTSRSSTASTSNKRKPCSRSASTESQQQQQQQQQQPEKEQEQEQEQEQEELPEEPPEPKPQTPTMTPTPSLSDLTPKEENLDDNQEFDDNQPLRRSKRKCPKKSSVQDDDFIYGSEHDDEDDDEDDDDVMMNEDDGESFNGSMPDVDSIDVHQPPPVADSTGYYQFEVKPYHIVKSRLGRKVFQCDICSGVYRHTFSLKRHYIRNHINYKYVSKTDRLNCNVNYNEADDVSSASSALQDKDPSPASLSEVEDTCSVKTFSSSSSPTTEEVPCKLAVTDGPLPGKPEGNGQAMKTEQEQDEKVTKLGSNDKEASPKDSMVSGETKEDSEDAVKEKATSPDREKESSSMASSSKVLGTGVQGKQLQCDSHHKDCALGNTLTNGENECEASVANENCKGLNKADTPSEGKQGELIKGHCECKVPCGDSQSETVKRKVPCGDSQSETVKSKVPCGDSQSETVKSNVLSGDSQSETWKSKVPCGDSQSEIGKSKVQCGDSQSETGDSKILSVDSQSETGKSKVPCGDSQSGTGKTKVPCGESQSKNVMSEVVSGDIQSETGKSKVPCGVDEVGAGDAKSPATLTKPSPSETKPPPVGCDAASGDGIGVSGQCKVPPGECKAADSEPTKILSPDVPCETMDKAGGEKGVKSEDPDATGEEEPLKGIENCKEIVPLEDGEVSASSEACKKDEKVKAAAENSSIRADDVTQDEIDGSRDDNSPVFPLNPGAEMEGVFRCNICEGLFDTVPELKEHLQHHPDVPSMKKFACNQCDMKFSHKQNLMRHQAVHSGSKPYLCKYCGKTFPTITNQKRHERIHQGRRFSCESCGTSFTQTGDLKKHIRKIHPDNFHECGFCSKYYTDQEQLLEHVDLIHPGEDINTNKKELSMRTEVFRVDLKKDRAESMRIALAKPGHRFACTICRKRFHDYANMCRHRRLAHQRQVLLNRRNIRTPEITMEALYGSFTEGDCPRPNGEFDFPSQYYASVARNIADNLQNFLEGKQTQLEHPESLIKWKEPPPEVKPETEPKKPEKTPEKKKGGKEEGSNMLKYNFPRGFQFKTPVELWKKKVDYFVVSPEKLLEEKTDEVEVEEELVESTNKEEEPTAQKDASDMRSPPPPQRRPVVAPPTIRVPKLHTCNVCHCVLHNFALYRQHMSYKHKVQIADHTPELLERIPGLQPVFISPSLAPCTIATAHSTNVPSTAQPAKRTSTAVSPPAHGSSSFTPAAHGSSKFTPSAHGSSKFSPLGHTSSNVSPPAHASLCSSPPAHALSISPPAHASSCISPPAHTPHPKTPPAHLSSALSPPAHSFSAISPMTCSEQPLDLSSPKSRFPPVNPFDPVDSGAVNLVKAKTPGMVSDGQNSDKPVDLTGSPTPDASSISDPNAKQKGDDDAKTPVIKPEPTKPDVHTKIMVKTRKSKFVCIACLEEWDELDVLLDHQNKDHPRLDCRMSSKLEVKPGMKALCCPVPNAVGLLNVCASQVPTQKEDDDGVNPVCCSKCAKVYPTIGDLHQHIIDYCANDGKPEEIYYGYIWIYRGKIKAKKRRKYRRPRNTPRKQGCSWGVKRMLDSLEEEEEGRRKRRRGMYELLYNPLNHIRRREMAEIVDTLSCRGCGVHFKTISKLERHIPACSHKDRLREIHVGKSQQEEDEDSDAYDPSKHMCIYCERLFTYLGMLRNHILDICHVRKEFVEQGDALDTEWEQDIINRAGPREPAVVPTLSRQSSVSSLVALGADDAADNADEDSKSSKRSGKKRKKTKHNWGYKVKNGERRQSKNSEEGDSPEGVFHDESSSSVGLPFKEESMSNSTETLSAAGKLPESEEKAHFSAVRNVNVDGSDGNESCIKPTEGKPLEDLKHVTQEQTDDANGLEKGEEKGDEKEDEDNKKEDDKDHGTDEKKESVVGEKTSVVQNKKVSSDAKPNKKRVSTDNKKVSPAKKLKSAATDGKGKPKTKTPKKSPLKTPLKTGASPVKKVKGKTPVKKSSQAAVKPSKSSKSQMEDSGVGDEDIDSDDDDVLLSALIASPKPSDTSTPQPSKAAAKKSTAKKTKTAAATPMKKLASKSPASVTKGANPAKKGGAKTPVKKTNVSKSGKKVEKVVKKFLTRKQSVEETATQVKSSPKVASKGTKKSLSETKASVKPLQNKSKDTGKGKSLSLAVVKKKLKL